MTKTPEFITKVKAWLVPLGYEIIYRINHPTATKDEVHYIKDGIRVVCELNHGEESFHLHMDILEVDPKIAIITCKYALQSDKLEELHKSLLATKKVLIAAEKDKLTQIRVCKCGCFLFTLDGKCVTCGEALPLK